MRIHRRRLRGRALKKQRKLLIISSFSFLLFLSIGYAAFQTNVTLNVKGNVKQMTKASFGGLQVRVVTSGDGLYAGEDSDGNDIFYYRGANPNNYITLGEDLYRIMEIDKDGNIKVIKDTPLSNMVWDPGYSTSIDGITSSSSTAGTRYSSSSSDYCYQSSASSYSGCKSWGSKTSTLNSAGTSNVTQMPWEDGNSTLKTLPEYDSYINAYLNGKTYPTSTGTTTLTSWYSTNIPSSLQSKLVNHLWNVGPVKSDSSLTLAQNIGQEAAYKWSGKVGLMTVTDYVRASTNSACTNVYNYVINSTCYKNSSTHNWLYKSSTQWTMAPGAYDNAYRVWYALSSGYLIYNGAYSSYDVRPVFYLASCTHLSGQGTSGSPYTVGADDGSCSGGGGSVTPTPSEPTYVYRWSTAQWSANQDISGMTEGTDYVTSASAVTNMNSRGANYYLKYKIENNVATESYVCFITDTEHCLRGGKQASENPSAFYESNVNNVLSEAETWFTASPQNGSCSLNPSGSYSYCTGGLFNYVDASSNGNVNVQDTDNSYCGVGSAGGSTCGVYSGGPT